MTNLKRKTTTGISLDKEMWNRIDKERGDVSRSRYVLRLIEKSINDFQDKNSTCKRKAFTVAESLRELPAN